MPLSLRQLELLRRKCAAEEVAIDLDLMADWTAQANRRITLEAALETLQQRLLEGKQ